MITKSKNIHFHHSNFTHILQEYPTYSHQDLYGSRHHCPSKREPRLPITKVALTTYKRGDSVQGSI